MNDLTSYIMDEYFTKWSSYRQTYFEPKWERNLAHYRLKDIDEGPAKPAWRSKTCVGLTRTKTMAGFSLVSDNLLQDGNFPFSVVCTPSMKASLRDMEEIERDNATTNLLTMGGHMKDQMLACRADVELSDIVTSAALYGDSYGRMVIGTYNDNPEEIPGLRAISVWDVVRDYSTDKIQDGLGIIHRHRLTAPDILSFVEAQDDILDISIVSTIMNGKAGTSHRSTLSTNPRENYEANDGKYELLECFVTVPTYLVIEGEVEDAMEWTKCIAYILDGEGIGVVVDGVGKRPFYHVPWQRDIDSATNISIPDNVEDMQLVMNKAFRGFEDNKALAGTVSGFYNPAMLDEEDIESFSITPGEFRKVADITDDANKAVSQLIIADVGQSYQSLITLADLFADEHSMIPKIAHGGGGGTEKTAFETSQQIDKAGKYIASVIRNFDEYLIEPYANDVYDFNLEFESPGFIDGLRCVAQGYSSYNDRIITSRKIQEFLQIAMTNEQFFSEFSPKRIAEALGSSSGMDIMAMLKTSKEKEEEQERQIEANKSAMALEEMQTQKLKAEIKKILTESEKNIGEAAMLTAEGEHFDAKAEAEAVSLELELELLEAKVEETKAKAASLRGGTVSVPAKPSTKSPSK